MDFLTSILRASPADVTSTWDGSRRPVDVAVPASRWMLLFLVLLSLVPRGVMAYRLDAVCDDGYYYIAVANSLESGDLEHAFSYLSLNVYPVLLWAGHALGFDWVVFGKLWGAIAASLVVLPLYGWVRRLFNDRVAAVACFLYAVHPNLIEDSVEPIRESTFWFLFTAALYLIWRAVDANRIGWYLLAGVTTTLAIHTRSEGWILVLPLVIWPVLRWSQTTTRRWNLATGPIAALAMTPLLLWAVNVTVLKDHSQWEWGRLVHFRIGWQWLQDQVGASRPIQSTRIDQSGHHSRSEQPWTTRGMRSGSMLGGSVMAAAPLPLATQSSPIKPNESFRWVYVKNLVETLEPINCLLLVLGLWIGRRWLLHRNKLPLWPLCFAILVGVWIRGSSSGDMNGRYFYTLTLLVVPFQALGLITVWQRFPRLGRRESSDSPSIKPLVMISLVLIGLFWTDAFTSKHPRRVAHAELGRWLMSELGPLDHVVVDRASCRVGYFARGTIPLVGAEDEPIDELLADDDVELVILSIKNTPHYQTPERISALESRGFWRIDVADLPYDREEFVVMTRRLPSSLAAKYAHRYATTGPSAAGQ